MKQIAFQKVNIPQKFHLQLATTPTTTIIELLSSQWNIKHNKSCKITTYFQNQYPTSLEDGQFDQLHKVYFSCIHFTQFIPLLFTLINAKSILESGTYCAENKLRYF